MAAAADPRTATPPTAPAFVMGLGLGGWGVFNLVEGLIDHQLLGIHHVRDDLGAPLGWDLAFLALGALLVAAGLALALAARRTGR